MTEAIIEINGIPTKVITWGRCIEESPGTTNALILLIPGNPGIPGFYKEFAKIIYEKTEIPVWCVGHAGHNLTDNSVKKCPQFNKSKELFGLKGQLNHKIEFFKKYISNDTKVYIIAHSIGCYMTLEILEHAYVKAKVCKSYLLFPTIERMAETKNGRFLINYVRPIVWLLLFLTWIFTLLPGFLANFLLYAYMFIANIPKDLHAQNIKDLLKPDILRNVFFLAFEEMDQVKERNNIVILNNVDKILFFYGKTDSWAPEQFYIDIKRDIFNVDAVLSTIDHTFIFHDSLNVAGCLADSIKPRN